MLTELPHTIHLPSFTSHSHSHPQTQQRAVPSKRIGKDTRTSHSIAQAWLTSFAAALSGQDTTPLASLLHPEVWHRDMLATSWDFQTVQGQDAVITFLGEHMAEVGFTSFRLHEDGAFAPAEKTPVEGLTWVEAMFDFETRLGRGKGMVRLVECDGEGNGPSVYKAYMLYTALQELKGHEDAAGERRPHGGNNSLIGGAIKGNWFDRRQRQMEFLDEEPAVVIIGAGQSGLNLAARLQAMGVSCLLVDKNKRIGDNWRNRYRTLVTHDPVQYTHMAYLPFPSNWPLFTPKDKLGDWFEAYASLMELNVWTSTTLQSSTYDDATSTWTITVQRPDSTSRTLHPRHVVLATGHAGEPKIPSFPGQSSFKGTVYHGSQHRDASETPGAATGKRVVVIGTGNSGHDIAQNYHEHGAASVTLVQRRGTYVISANKGLFMLHKGMYEEGGPPLEDADVAGQSLPIAVQFALNVGLTKQIKAADEEMLNGLERRGFKLDYAEDGSGIYRKYITRGGGYYIDVGASQLIVDGLIDVVQSPDGIKGFDADALVLADGRRLEADVVVLATGFDNMLTTATKVLGAAETKRCGDVWDLDEQGEVKAMWRPSGHPGLWFMGGSLALCRTYSRFLALQIKAREEGLVKV